MLPLHRPNVAASLAILFALAPGLSHGQNGPTRSPSNAFYFWNNGDGPGLGAGLLATPQVFAPIVANSRQQAACEFPTNDFSTLYCLEKGTNFNSYNTSTGAETIVNAGGSDPGSSNRWTGMATDPTTDQTYAVSRSTGSGPGSLWTIDLNTGFVVHVGLHSNSNSLNGIAFDSGGQLFGLEPGFDPDLEPDSLLKVDKTTGATTFVGLTGIITRGDAFSMDLDEDDGTIYAVVRAFDEFSVLTTVNSLTGAFNTVGILGLTFPGSADRIFGPIAIAATNTTLPVELAEFAVTAVDERIRVAWVTASETDNAGFDVEISTDGRSFVSRGYVEGAGTTTERQEYSYEIAPLNAGRNFVRLKQIDFDGAFEYSDIIEVSTEVPGGFTLEAAYPNPFNPATVIRFVVDAEMPATLDVFDTQGRLIERLYENVAPAGALQSITFDATGLPGGLYFYRLQTPVGSKTQSVMLLR